MKTKYEVKLPVRSAGRTDSSCGELAPEWDLSLWFALLSPLIGVLLGILGGFVLYH